jgi:1-acyl-sn-glycerol-3-phosphate acyltransferase
MKGIVALLILLAMALSPVLLTAASAVLILGIISSPFIVIALIFIRRKVKDLAKQLNIDLRRAAFIWIILSSIPLNALIRVLKQLNRIVIIGNFPWEKKGVLTVTNHPSWFDQAAVLQFIISYLEWLKDPQCFPLIGVARDSIVRLPFLKAFETFLFLLPVERYKRREMGLLEERMAETLRNGGNLIISGPAGRDFKAKEKEIIYSPLKKKPLRIFGGLCGRLATIEGVTTVPGYIEGTEKLFVAVETGEGIKFSFRKLFIDFLLLGKFQIKIVFVDNPLILEGWPKEKARKTIEKAVLRLADMC